MLGLYHLGEQPGIDSVVQGLAEITDSSFGIYQVCGYGQIPSFPLSLSVFIH